MKIHISKIFTGLVLLVVLAANYHFSTTFAQGTAFTYQGRLNDNGNPANGAYDIRTGLYTTNTGGTLFAGLITNSTVTVSNGLFTIPLDYGGVFNGTIFWLQIAVRTNGGGAFVVLSPRQQLTPAPYAEFATTASNLSGTIGGGGLSGTYGNPLTLSNAANQFTGTYTGNGTGLTNVNAAALDGLAAPDFWQTTGNSGTTAGANYLGTADNQPLELHVNGTRGLRLEPTPALGTVNVVGGSSSNYVGPGAIGATIAGGGSLAYSGVHINTIAASMGTIGGGDGNSILTNASESTIAGGNQNYILDGAYRSTIAGGFVNGIETNSYQCAVGGGYSNVIQTNVNNSIIAGGYVNTIRANISWGTIAGGGYGTVGDLGGVIGGGWTNTIQAGGGIYSVIAGGQNNMIQGNADHSAIGGGSFNTIIGSYAFGVSGTIGGGYENTIQTNTSFATIGGGLTNTAGGFQCTIGGGYGNTATNYNATVGGGFFNTASGNTATVPGGNFNLASGDYSFAAGSQAQALHRGSFVWADSQNAAFASATTNEFSLRAQNGVRLQTTVGIHLNAADEPLIVRDWNPFATNAPADKAGIGRWGLFMEPSYLTIGIPSDDIPGRYFQVAKYSTNGTPSTLITVDQGGNLYVTNNVYAHGVLLTSDRNAKENFAAVDPGAILAKVAALPVTEWNYKTDPAEQKHIGPVAQDFQAAFGLDGFDDKHISAVDEGGVALAAIQGLNQKLTEQLKARDAEIEQLKQDVAGLKALLTPPAGQTAGNLPGSNSIKK